MGYCISLMESDFKISKKNNEDKAIVDELKRYLLDNVETQGGGGVYSEGKTTKHYSWVDNTEIEAVERIGDILAAFRYEPDYDELGNICDIYFEGEKIGDEAFLFTTLAPYIEKGSYLTYRGEDNAMWQYYFDGEKMIEKSGRVIFD